MEKLTQEAFQNAKSFIMNHGRQLEQRLFEYHFEGGTKEAVLEALSRYHNSDGGFGHGLEPDFRTPASSSYATTVALGYFRELKVPSSSPRLQAAIKSNLRFHGGGYKSQNERSTTMGQILKTEAD